MFGKWQFKNLETDRILSQISKVETYLYDNLTEDCDCTTPTSSLYKLDIFGLNIEIKR